MRVAALCLSFCVSFVGCADDGLSVEQSSTTMSEPSDGQATTTLASTTSSVSDAQLAKARSVGDIATGEELFRMEIDGIPRDLACSTCHTLDGVAGRSPSLLGISNLAADRIDGLSDIEYLRQSLTDPLGFIAGDWPSTMPYQYGEVLDEEQVDNLIAFLLTK